MTKEKIIEYLVELDLYHNSDDILIELLADEIAIYKAAMDDIRSDGTMSLQTDITRNPDKEPFNIINRSVAVREKSAKSIMNLCKMLGLSSVERKKMKMEMEAGEDEFERAFKDKN